jgi:AcrR family transcriptional regulator
MATVVTREAYFETGLDVLSDLGYGGLKLAEVCNRLGVTTGSFYHYFENWSAYTSELVQYWRQTRTQQMVEKVLTEAEPRERIDAIIEIGLALPHGAEAAFRSWSSVNPVVAEVQGFVDRQRFEILRDSALELLDGERQAQLFASWAMYLLVGYEQSMLPRDPEGLAWIATQLTDALDSGRFDTAPE